MKEMPGQKSSFISVLAWTGATVAVILVIAFLGLLWLKEMRSQQTGQMGACWANLGNLGTAMEMYSTDFSGRYPAQLSHLTPNYLKTIPTCPSAGLRTYTLDRRVNPDLYTLVCAGSNHTHSTVVQYRLMVIPRQVKVPPDYPQYTSVEGLIKIP